MTNKEKFKEVFGFEPNVPKNCIAPAIVCAISNNECQKCAFHKWWEKEYKPCFKMRDFDNEQVNN